MNEKMHKSKILKERQIIGYFFYPLYLLHWFYYEILWRISSRSWLKMKLIRSVDELDTGLIYYTRTTPFNTSGFDVYFPNNDEENDLWQASLSDRTLSGKSNYHFISVKEAKEKGYTFDYDYLAIEEEYRKSVRITIPKFDLGDDGKEREWITANVPEAYQIIHANCGKDRFSPSLEGITSREYMKMLIEERRCVYKLTDRKMTFRLESYGLYDSMEKWEEYFAELQHV